MKALKQWLNQTNPEENSICVLKGFALADLDLPIPDLAATLANKFARFGQIVAMPKAVLAFDEFIALYPFVIEQYARIHILENQAYLNLCPPGATLPAAASQALLTHFDSECTGEAPIGEIDELLNIYSNYLQVEDDIACCYNFPDHWWDNLKIHRHVLNNVGQRPAPAQDLPAVPPEAGDIPYYPLYEEKDYFDLVGRLTRTTQRYAVSWVNYIAGQDLIQNRLQQLAADFPGRLWLYRPAVIPPPGCDAEVFAILKRVWGYDGFRTFRVYDMAALGNQEVKVNTVSQEHVVGDLIRQAEHCRAGEEHRDVFVTAPTGSGKSLMFQVPAIHLAEKYNLLTLVVTPLIGLMNDQVQALAGRGYNAARTINSDISPLVKQEILQDVAEGRCHLLYLSPESLLSRSDIQQLIGRRLIGLLVVDEAHIVTTWGKQFRPDYWYLGDHVQKLRKAQSKQEDGHPFVIATFTATAIYEGSEDMYHETLNSLHMLDPITYLGYLRRDNIAIAVSEVEVRRNKTEYEVNKFDALLDMIRLARLRGQKSLIYFPTVSLIQRFFAYSYSKGQSEGMARYHGQMEADDKAHNFHGFLSGTLPVMLATKAFGMGIDIPDIQIVAHFAPTGNVCDYMQEIGRAARDPGLTGQAIYQHMRNDFKHINRLHGLSALREYQLVEVTKKVLELYEASRYRTDSVATKRRNEMLVDAESFAYIFDGPLIDDSGLINKVKTAMLLIQKDYENRGFAPFYMRPIPLFAYGFVALAPDIYQALQQTFPGCAQATGATAATSTSPTSALASGNSQVYRINLKQIWESHYGSEMSFPRFKYLLYAKTEDFAFNRQFPWQPALAVQVYLKEDGDQRFAALLSGIKAVTLDSVSKSSFLGRPQLVKGLVHHCSLNHHKAESLLDVLLASLSTYQREYTSQLQAKVYRVRQSEHNVSYQFFSAINGFFTWIGRVYDTIKAALQEETLYLVEDGTQHRAQALTALGLLESMNVLRFSALGGDSSQIYIYVNETKTMQMVRDKPHLYHNRLLAMIGRRHQDSVAMLTFLFQNRFSSDEIWDYLENYFLGILPPELAAGSEG